MDKLLFRAWNKRENRMYPVICINLDKKEVIVDTIAISKEYKEKIPTLKYRYPRDVLMLQYIWREDINKKKIFEGDIIRWKVSEKGYSDNFIKNDYITGVIVRCEEECCFKIEQITEGMNIFKFEDFVSENNTKFYDEEGQQKFDWNDTEIIGNRFDDPHLLINGDEQKKQKVNI